MVLFVSLTSLLDAVSLIVGKFSVIMPRSVHACLLRNNLSEFREYITDSNLYANRYWEHANRYWEHGPEPYLPRDIDTYASSL